MLRRPVLFFSVIYACGELAAFYSVERSSPLLFFFALSALAAVSAGLERDRDLPDEYSVSHEAQAGRLAVKAFAVFLAGAAVMTVQTAGITPKADECFSASGVYEVRILNVRPCSGGVYLDCGPADGETGIPAQRVRLRRTETDGLSPQEEERLYGLIGSTAFVGAELEMSQKAGNPRTFDYRNYLMARGIGLTGKLISIPSEGDTTERGGAFAALRTYIAKSRNAFLRRLSADDRAFAAGVLFGDTTGMEDDELAEFRGNGTAHILAVSGLHIGVLVSLLTRLRKRLGGSWTVIPCAAILLLYGEASCWSPSVVRAVMLAIVRMTGEVLDRPYDSTEAAASVSAVIISARPYMLLDTGFQMSFLALLSINFLLPYLRGRLGSGISVMLAVQAAIVPYTALVFNTISPVGLLLNIPLIFLTSIYTPVGAAGFFAELASGVLPGAAPLLRAFAALVAGLGRLIRFLNHLFFAGGKALARVPSPPLFAAAVFFCAMFMLASEWGEVYIRARKSRRMKKLLALVMLVAALSAFVIGRSPFDRADQVFLDVGQGDSLHIKDGRGTDILIDGGGSAYRNVGRDVLMVYLLRNGVRDVDLALATHLHADHYLGLEQLDEEYPVNRVITRGLAGDEIIVSDSLRIEILWPTPENADSSDENYSSLVFMVEQKGIRTLVTGDLTEEGERALLQMYGGTGALKCDILKVAHHGSRFSSTDAFLEEASPLIAVISVGKNEYGHPSPEVIKRLESRGAAVYRTDLDGAVGVIVGDGTVEVRTARSGRREVFRLEFGPGLE